MYHMVNIQYDVKICFNMLTKYNAGDISHILPTTVYTVSTAAVTVTVMHGHWEMDYCVFGSSHLSDFE